MLRATCLLGALLLTHSAAEVWKTLREIRAGCAIP
jgi:hypothetical protein